MALSPRHRQSPWHERDRLGMSQGKYLDGNITGIVLPVDGGLLIN
jgi:hypothetical protein